MFCLLIAHPYFKGYENKASLVNTDSFLCSVGVILLSGYMQLPSKKMYWEASPDTFSNLVSSNIRRDTFEAVLFSTHFVDNTLAATTIDRFYKVGVCKYYKLAF